MESLWPHACARSTCMLLIKRSLWCLDTIPDPACKDNEIILMLILGLTSQAALWGCKHADTTRVMYVGHRSLLSLLCLPHLDKLISSSRSQGITVCSTTPPRGAQLISHCCTSPEAEGWVGYFFSFAIRPTDETEWDLRSCDSQLEMLQNANIFNHMYHA